MIRALKKKNTERVRIYRESECDTIKARRNTPEYLKKHNEWENKRYHRKKDEIAAKMKIKRQTPEYKQKMKAYREKRKAIISQQEVITKKRYHEKNRDGITDKYVIGVLKSAGCKNPTRDQIEIKRGEIILSRIKEKIRTHLVGETKICSICKEEKDLSEFYVVRKKNRRMAYCKKCSSEKGSQYRESKKQK